MSGEGDGVRLKDQHFYYRAQNTLLDPHQEVLAEEMGGQRVCVVGGSSKQMELDWRGTDKESALISEMLELIDIYVYKGEARTPLTNITSMENIPGSTCKGKGSRK